jgi:hypothetical protein
MKNRGLDELHAARFTASRTWSLMAARGRKSGFAPVGTTISLGRSQSRDPMSAHNCGCPIYPDFLWSFVGSLIFIRLSLKERRTR